MSKGRKLAKWIALIVLAGGIGAGIYLLNSTTKNVTILRVGIIVLSLVAWFISQSLIGAATLGGAGIGDAIHNLTARMNSYLNANPKAANILLIISSAFISIFTLFLIALSIFGPSMRPFAALILLFLLRQIAQSMCALPKPPGLIWRYPGFPSLLVTYGIANDFFFSGHTAIAVLGAIELWRMGPWWLGLIGAVIALLEAFVVLILRAHYTMDVFTGVIAAFFAAGLVHWAGM